MALGLNSNFYAKEGSAMDKLGCTAWIQSSVTLQHAQGTRGTCHSRTVWSPTVILVAILSSRRQELV